MSLNRSPTGRSPGGGTTGKRGRPESLVRQFWEDINVPDVGPKCIFCDHRSMTRNFRAPPATRHTLICKNAPESVKEELRRATNNKYSRRRPPLASSSSAKATANTPIPAPAHRSVSHPTGGPSQGAAMHAAHGHAAQPTHAGQANGAGPSQPSFSFVKHPTAHGEGGHHEGNGAMATLSSSPRHINGPTGVAPMAPSANIGSGNVETGVVAANVRSALLTDHQRANTTPRTMGIAVGSGQGVATTTLTPTADLLYGGNGAPRLLTATTDLNTQMSDIPKHVALTEAVVEALFESPPRNRSGAVPTPAEFRSALREIRDFAKMRMKRQRDEARREVSRLQEAIALLVEHKNGQHRNLGGGNSNNAVPPPADAADSDESEDEIRVSRAGWNGYDGRK